MKRLFVLFDGECPFCVRCQLWLNRQPRFIPLVCMSRQSRLAAERFAPLLERAGAEDLLVVSDEGAIYRGDAAYLMCLWSLKEYRGWASRLASPALRPLVRRFFKLVASNREWISAWLGEVNDQALGEVLRQESVVACATGPAQTEEQASPATGDVLTAREELRSWG